MAEIEFLSPYEVAAVLDGAITANPLPKPRAMSMFLATEKTTLQSRVNFDYEFGATNIMANFVAPTVDATALAHSNFGTKEMYFSYAKAAVESPALSEISQRMFGQPFGVQQNYQANYNAIVAQDMVRADETIQNLEELVATNLLVYGSYTTAIAGDNAQHPEVTYDWGRTKLENSSATTQASRDSNRDAVYHDWIPEVDLTTLKANTSTNVGGGLSWDSKDASNSNATVTPVATVHPIEHVRRMVRNCKYRAGSCSAVVMSEDAWAWYHKDLSHADYADLRDLLKTAQPKIDPMILQKLPELQGYSQVGWVIDDLNMVIPIFVYSGIYHDRKTGEKTKYFPNGYVLALPSPSYGFKIYGRILHPKAAWLPAKRWVNTWMNEKTGFQQWEMHSNLLLGHADINTVISWKVCSTAPASPL